MSVESELVSEINAALPSLSGRVYAVKLPQNASFPAIRINRISANREQTLSGPDCLLSARFQVDVFAETFDAARDTFNTTRQALNGFEGTDIKWISLDNERDEYEDETGLYRVIGDFIIEYHES